MTSNPYVKFGQKPDRKLNELLRLFEKPGRAFVPAAGRGSTAKALLDTGWKVLAIDNDPYAIKEMGNFRKKKKDSHFTLKEVDVRNYEIDKNEFDLVIASNFFHFFKTEVALELIQKITTSLKKDGVLFVRLFTNEDFMFEQKPENFYPNRNEINDIFSGLEFLNSEIKTVEDNHPPYGPHTHVVFELIAKKSSNPNGES